MKAKDPDFTQEYLQSLLSYNRDTGELRWKERPLEQFKTLNACRSWNGKYSHSVAGYTHKLKSGISYIAVGLNYKQYQAHRLIWMLVYGEWPDQIDHIDGNGLNNRLDNLRNITHQENSKNCKLPKNNTTGIAGIRWHKRDEVWDCGIGVNYKRIFLGYFDDFFEACCVRKSAENRYGFHKNHGR